MTVPQEATPAAGFSPPPARSDRELVDANRRFYDPLWARSRLVSAERFNTWPLVRSLLREGAPRLELAPGLRPRFPLQGTRFLDASEPAVSGLRAHGADATLGVATRLPFADGEFSLLGAFDIVEHVDDDDAVLAELARVARSDATLLLSAPLHAARWVPFDDLVGHCRRYDPAALVHKLLSHGWTVEQSAVFGMQPQSSRLLDWGVHHLVHNTERAIWLYDRVILPIGMRLQKRLALVPGMMPADDVDEVLLVCRRVPTGGRRDLRG